MKVGKGDIILNPRGTWFRVVEVGKQLSLLNIETDRLVRKDRAEVEAKWTMHIPSINSRLREARAERGRAAKAVPLETRQRFLDLLGEGKTLGEAASTVGLNTEIAFELFRKAHKTHRYITFEPKAV